MLAPICLFTYNRLEETIKTVNALKENFLADKSDLIIFSDAAKNNQSTEVVQNVRNYLKTISGFKSIEIIESIENKGLAESIIQGVTKVITEYGRVIVLEDDLVTSKNFLVYMNESLVFYESNNLIFSVSGYVPKILKENSDNNDAFIYGRAHSWGWSTWKDRWDVVDWKVLDWQKMSNDKDFRKKLSYYGTDLFKMLKDYFDRKNNSWYVRFTLSQQLYSRFTIYPFETKVMNIGFNSNATHCDTYNRSNFELDKKSEMIFRLPMIVSENEYYYLQMVYYKSVYYRICNRLLTFLLKRHFIKQRKGVYYD